MKLDKYDTTTYKLILKVQLSLLGLAYFCSVSAKHNKNKHVLNTEIILHTAFDQNFSASSATYQNKIFSIALQIFLFFSQNILKASYSFKYRVFVFVGKSCAFIVAVLLC